MSETAKVRLLLKKVEHPQLQDAIGALRVRSAIDEITFTECANHLAALVSELPDQQSSRKISGATTDKHKQNKNINWQRNINRQINVRYYIENKDPSVKRFVFYKNILYSKFWHNNSYVKQ